MFAFSDEGDAGDVDDDAPEFLDKDKDFKNICFELCFSDGKGARASSSRLFLNYFGSYESSSRMSLLMTLPESCLPLSSVFLWKNDLLRRRKRL